MGGPVIVIPARWASTRFPGKPLAKIAGQSLLSRTVGAARAVAGIDRLLVATDDARIAKEAEAAGAEWVMTSGECRNGTERVAEAVAKLADAADIIVNLQGDAPLTPPWFIDALISAMSSLAAVEVATPVLRMTPEGLARLRADRATGHAGATTVVTDARGDALYFSKEILPHGGGTQTPVLHHVGVYAYRRDALLRYPGLPPGNAEIAEGLEQLRFLEHGVPIACIEVEAPGLDFWEVNRPGDVARVEAILKTEALS